MNLLLKFKIMGLLPIVVSIITNSHPILFTQIQSPHPFSSAPALPRLRRPAPPLFSPPALHVPVLLLEFFLLVCSYYFVLFVLLLQPAPRFGVRIVPHFADDESELGDPQPWVHGLDPLKDLGSKEEEGGEGLLGGIWLNKRLVTALPYYRFSRMDNIYENRQWGKFDYSQSFS